jgi:hypothetical protein
LTPDKSLARRFRAMNPEACKELSIKARQEGRPNEAFAIVYEMTTETKVHRALVAETLERTIQHPGDITGFVALYWAKGSQASETRSRPCIHQIHRTGFC